HAVGHTDISEQLILALGFVTHKSPSRVRFRPNRTFERTSQKGGDSEVRGERYESRSEPSPRTRGYATLRRTSCLFPARRPANCQGAKAVRQHHGCLAASTFSLLDLRAPTPQSAQAAADAAPRWHHLGWKSPPCSQARLERPL